MREAVSPILAVLRLNLAALLLLLVSSAALAQGVGEGDRAAIRAVIESQLAAMQRDDNAAAFSYASPAIQRQFGDPDTFMDMVRSAYAPVYRPREVEFRDLLPDARGLVQEVYMTGPDGAGVIARYLMQQQPDGSWRINGCTLVEAPDQTA